MSNPANPLEYILETFHQSQLAREAFAENYSEKIIEVAQSMGAAIKFGNKVLICGNGGSAADAQHMAAELVGRMLVERKALPAIALTTDSSNLTAIGNDYGYEFVFSRQVEALANPGDIFIGISTSGNSPNVIKALESAIEKGCITVCLTGGSGGKMVSMYKDKIDHLLIVEEGKNSSTIQESHIFAVHSIVDIMDRYFLA